MVENYAIKLNILQYNNYELYAEKGGLGLNKLKLLRNYIVILLVLSILFSLNACRTKNIKTDYNETELRYISNEQIHFNSIPWTFKKIEFLPNGSIALDNVVVTKPDGSKLPLTPEGFLYSFVPDNQGVYCISYDYTYSNHFENVLPEDKSSLIWEKGAFTFNVKNYPIPEDYYSIQSNNKYINIHYPKETSNDLVDLVLEIKPLPKPAVVSVIIKDYANFPEAYKIPAERNVTLYFSQKREYAKNGIEIELHEQSDQNKIFDSLSFTKDIPYIPLPEEELNMNGEEKDKFLSHLVYYLENGDLKIWDYKTNKVTILLSGKNLSFFDLSPKRNYIALSNKVDTYICSYSGKDFRKIGGGMIRPKFISEDEVIMVSSSRWNEAKSANYGNVVITNNVYAMPLYIYNTVDSKISHEFSINVYLGDRWGMYYPTFADVPVELYPFKMDTDSYLFKIAFPGLTEKWIKYYKNTIEDYTYENVPWIPTKPYINQEFMFEGDVVTAILRKVTYSNQDDVLYVDINYAELSAPEDNGRYLAFVRTIKDHFSAPSFYIESHSELCVFDKCTGKIERIPVRGIEELHLGGN